MDRHYHYRKAEECVTWAHQILLTEEGSQDAAVWAAIAQAHAILARTAAIEATTNTTRQRATGENRPPAIPTPQNSKWARKRTSSHPRSLAPQNHQHLNLVTLLYDSTRLTTTRRPVPAPVLQLRVPEESPARIDEARGDDIRSAWLQRLIDRELTGQTTTAALPLPPSPSSSSASSAAAPSA